MESARLNHTKLGWLPNAISLARLCSIPVLLWLAHSGAGEWFAALLVAALASDLVDGWLARRLNVSSSAGALLDSVADMALTLTILVSIWLMRPVVYQQDGWIIYSLSGAWLLAHVASLIRYGKLASFHTWLIRVGIAFFNLFAVILFLFDYYPWMLHVAGVLSCLGVVEHFILLALLPKWSPDLPGGIPQALARRESGNNDNH